MVKTSEASEARDEESDDGVVSTGEPELRFPKHRINDLPEVYFYILVSFVYLCHVNFCA